MHVSCSFHYMIFVFIFCVHVHYSYFIPSSVLFHLDLIQHYLTLSYFCYWNVLLDMKWRKFVVNAFTTKKRKILYVWNCWIDVIYVLMGFLVDEITRHQANPTKHFQPPYIYVHNTFRHITCSINLCKCK